VADPPRILAESDEGSRRTILLEKVGRKTMVEVRITDKNNFERAMRIFKKQCQKEGFLVEAKERRYYTKPSERKRRKATGRRS